MNRSTSPATTGACVPARAICPSTRIIGRVSTTAYSVEARCPAAARSSSTSDASVDAAGASGGGDGGCSFSEGRAIGSTTAAGLDIAPMRVDLLAG